MEGSNAIRSLRDTVRCRLLLILLCTLAVAYLIQMPGPLRLNTDAIQFLTLASEAARHPGPLPAVNSPLHPPGYPAILALMMRAGLANSATFVALNLLAIGAGLWAFGEIAKGQLKLSTFETRHCQCITLLSFVMIKHAFIPLSDPLFFGVSMLALMALMKREEAPGSWRWLLCAALLTALAISIRSIGIALIPALLLAVVPARRFLVSGLCVFSGLAAVIPLSRSEYLRAFLMSHSKEGSIVETVAERLRELGEIAINVPASHVSRLPAPLFAALGSVVILVLIRAVWLRRGGWGVLEVYAAAYAFILAVWPFGDTRFWLPILPLLAGLVFIVIRQLPRTVGLLIGAAYALPGLAAIAFSLWLSFSGSSFPDRYGDGTLKPVYRAAWAGNSGTTDEDRAVVSLLRQFEPRAKK